MRIVDTSGSGTSGYVQLNDGKEFAWTSADADLQVEGPLGELVHLDFTAITAGFNGDVDVTSTGQLIYEILHPLLFRLVTKKSGGD